MYCICSIMTEYHLFTFATYLSFFVQRPNCQECYEFHWNKTFIVIRFVYPCNSNFTEPDLLNSENYFQRVCKRNSWRNNCIARSISELFLLLCKYLCYTLLSYLWVVTVWDCYPWFFKYPMQDCDAGFQNMRKDYKVWD